jgi:hypothetical protein
MSSLALRKQIEDLERVLKQEIALYREYASVLNSDTELMAKLKVEELEKNNKTKNTLVLKMKTFDQARQTMIKQFAALHGISSDSVKLADICEHLQKDDAKRLLALRDELKEIIKSFEGLQRSTASLAQTSLVWVNSTISTLHRMLSPTGTYNLQGKVDGETLFAGRVVEKQI